MQKYDLLLMVKFPELICLSSAHMLNFHGVTCCLCCLQGPGRLTARGGMRCVCVCLHVYITLYLIPNSILLSLLSPTFRFVCECTVHARLFTWALGAFEVWAEQQRWTEEDKNNKETESWQRQRGSHSLWRASCTQ